MRLCNRYAISAGCIENNSNFLNRLFREYSRTTIYELTNRQFTGFKDFNAFNDFNDLNGLNDLNPTLFPLTFT